MPMKLIPLIFAILNRARVLKGATTSRTTRKQMAFLFPAAVIVAAIGFFAPEILPEAAQDGVVIFIVGLLSASPYLLRMAGYKEPYQNAEVELYGVQDRVESDSIWHAYSGTTYEAHEQGWKRGVSYAGNIYDLETGAKIGEVPRRTPDGNPLEDLLVRGIGKRTPPAPPI